MVDRETAIKVASEAIQAGLKGDLVELREFFVSPILKADSCIVVKNDSACLLILDDTEHMRIEEYEIMPDSLANGDMIVSTSLTAHPYDPYMSKQTNLDFAADDFIKRCCAIDKEAGIMR